MNRPRRGSLPALSDAQLFERFQAVSPSLLSRESLAALTAHYRELARWNPLLSLIGPGTESEVFERHYGESLAALPLLEGQRATLVDLGSGGGFPGFVLAATCPELEVVLVEAQQRKAVFLDAARRRASLSLKVLNARVSGSLPSGWPAATDIVTSRAVRLEPEILRPVTAALGPADPDRVPRLLLWAGREPLDLPAPWRVSRRVDLVGSAARQVVEARPDVSADSAKEEGS